MTARARDVFTHTDGSAEVLGEARFDAVVDYADAWRLTAIESEPARSWDALVGTSVASGFRGRVLAAMPREGAERTLLNVLLDDLPGALVVSGYAAQRLGGAPPATPSRARAMEDLCSGWRRGGTIMLEIERGTGAPVVTGPPAGNLDAADDPWAWHHIGELGPHGMRRLRRVDLLPGHPAVIDAYFRDSHLSDTLEHTAIHEYSVRGGIEDGVFTDLRATAHALPWFECPNAVGSATWLVGTPAADLRRRVRQDFTGVDTCTHLNDMLRGLEDLTVLSDVLATRSGAT